MTFIQYRHIHASTGYAGNLQCHTTTTPSMHKSATPSNTPIRKPKTMIGLSDPKRSASQYLETPDLVSSTSGGLSNKSSKYALGVRAVGATFKLAVDTTRP